MATAQYTAQVRGSLLLELPPEAAQLHLKPGGTVRIQLDQDTDDLLEVSPGERMISFLREISERDKGRRHTDGSSTDKMLREARAGAMWGCDPIE